MIESVSEFGIGCLCWSAFVSLSKFAREFVLMFVWSCALKFEWKIAPVSEFGIGCLCSSALRFQWNIVSFGIDGGAGACLCLC